MSRVVLAGADEDLILRVKQAADGAGIECSVSARELTRFALVGDQFASVSKMSTGTPYNDFAVTNQYRVHGIETIKADTVLLVNGIPLVLAEYKSYMNSRKDWKEGVNQLHRYHREAPALLASATIMTAATEFTYPVMDGFKWRRVYYGPHASPLNTDQIVNGHVLAITARLTATAPA